MSKIFGGFIAGFIVGRAISSEVFGCSHTPDEWLALEEVRDRQYAASHPIKEAQLDGQTNEQTND